MKRVLFFGVIVAIATFSTISRAVADCTPAPQNQSIKFIAQAPNELMQLSQVYGVLSDQDAQRCIAENPSITTTVTTTTTTTVVIIVIVQGSQSTDNSVNIQWNGPILGQCEYPGPGTPIF